MVLGNVVMTNIVIGIIVTLIVLVLSLVTITKGYGFKHTIDPHPNEQEKQDYVGEENKDEGRES